GVLPPPLIDSPRCEGCSLVGICLPDETNLLRGVEVATNAQAPQDANAMDAFWPVDSEEDGGRSEVVLRRLQPARDDLLPLYVQEQGAKISLAGEELVVRGKEGNSRARLPNVSQVTLFGNVQISTQALRAVMERGISLSFLSTGGWFYGR